MGRLAAAGARWLADARPNPCRRSLVGEWAISQWHSVRAGGGGKCRRTDSGPGRSHPGVRSAPVRGMSFQLDPRLEADTAFVSDWPLCRVLLMNDARYPWLVLAPRRLDLVEIGDL